MICRNVTFAMLCTALVACAATTPKPRPSARLEIQEEVGFTITESVTVSDEVRQDYERSLVLLVQGQTKQGLAILESVVGRAPDVSGPRVDLGIAQHRAGDLAAAEEHLKKALALNPEHPVALNELGIVYRKGGRFDEARRQYERALAVYPAYHHAHRNLGVLCDLYLQDLECALSSYEAYTAMVPGDEQAAMWVADLRSRIGHQE